MPFARQTRALQHQGKVPCHHSWQASPINFWGEGSKKLLGHPSWTIYNLANSILQPKAAREECFS